MRREFILVLMGIVCISTLSSLLSGYVHVDTDIVLLDTVLGTVGAGNFSYWQLGHTGPLLVELTSLSGDADLYVSDTTRPGYEVDMNNFSSTTCGPDLVLVPADFPRPIGIGVFGHWSESRSDYSIQVFLDTAAMFTGDQLLAGNSDRHHLEGGGGESKQGKDKHPVSRKQGEDESKPRFMKLLNMLDMIFEMFIL